MTNFTTEKPLAFVDSQVGRLEASYLLSEAIGSGRLKHGLYGNGKDSTSSDYRGNFVGCLGSRKHGNFGSFYKIDPRLIGVIDCLEQVSTEVTHELYGADHKRPVVEHIEIVRKIWEAIAIGCDTAAVWLTLASTMTGKMIEWGGSSQLEPLKFLLFVAQKDGMDINRAKWVEIERKTKNELTPPSVNGRDFYHSKEFVNNISLACRASIYSAEQPKGLIRHPNSAPDPLHYGDIAGVAARDATHSFLNRNRTQKSELVSYLLQLLEDPRFYPTTQHRS